MIRHRRLAHRLLFSVISNFPYFSGGREAKPRSALQSAMAIHLRAHAFAGSPFRSSNGGSRTLGIDSPASALAALKSLLSGAADGSSPPPDFKVLAFKRGKPLARSPPSDPISSSSSSSPPKWHLGWTQPRHFIGFSADSFVYLGSAFSQEEVETVYWALDLTNSPGLSLGGGVGGGGSDWSCFVELRTLMIATDWTDELAMDELAIAGQARALLEWHNTSRFCGDCGTCTIPVDSGRKKQCTNESCKKRIYPRVDPVVIMLVIDKENDRALLSRQSRFVPRMWSCLAGFIEPGESLEDAVRRETREETGIEVGEVVYHSSQPWPVGPNSMPCQLMVGFFAYAKSFDIRVDKDELEDARWHAREDVKRSLVSAEYEKAQQTAAVKVSQMCRGVVEGRNLSVDFNTESGELAPMFVPGPFAIAHHLVSSWAHRGAPDLAAAAFLPPQPSNSMSSL